VGASSEKMQVMKEIRRMTVHFEVG
jgi:hypothetical protein